MEVGVGPVYIVLDGDTASLPKRAPQFSDRLYCGQTAGCIKLALAMEVGLSPGDFVLDGDRSRTPKRAEPHPIFGPRLMWRNGCMDQDTAWYGGRLRPMRHCVRCGPSYLQKKGITTPPNFWGRNRANPCLLRPNGWMDEDAAWYGSRPRSRPVVV